MKEEEKLCLFLGANALDEVRPSCATHSVGEESVLFFLQRGEIDESEELGGESALEEVLHLLFMAEVVLEELVVSCLQVCFWIGHAAGLGKRST